MHTVVCNAQNEYNKTMKRRKFIKSAILGIGAITIPLAVKAAPGATNIPQNTDYRLHSTWANGPDPKWKSIDIITGYNSTGCKISEYVERGTSSTVYFSEILGVEINISYTTN